MTSHVLIFGSASTGKSAVGALLADRLGLPLIDGLERDADAPLDQIRGNRRAMERYQSRLYMRAINAQSISPPSVITTPALLVATYSELLLGWVPVHDMLACRSRCLLFLPAPTVEADGFRVDDRKFNRRLHAALEQNLRRLSVRYVTVPWCVTPAEKAELCLEVINEYQV